MDSKRPEDLLSALEQLTQALSSTGDFLGRQLTVADIAILSTLHPLAASGKVSPKKEKNPMGLNTELRMSYLYKTQVSGILLVSFTSSSEALMYKQAP